MNLRTLLIMCEVLAASAAFGRVKAPTGGITLDGRLDEADWTTADWEGGFVKIGNVARQKGDETPKAQSEFALLADDDALYVGVRCFEPKMPRPYAIDSLWCVDAVEVLLAPGGRSFDFYQFVTPLFTEQRFQTFWSEGGNIQPDPYGPEWKSAVWRGDDQWTVEFRIPFNAFYMTRQEAWSTTWLVNVARNNRQNGELTSWAHVKNSFKESGVFPKVGGFPKRKPTDDIAVLSAVAEITNSTDGVHVGVLSCDVFAGVAGTYAVSTSCGAVEKRKLNDGLNKLKLPCRFKGNGRHAVAFELTRCEGGNAYRRTYPVDVDFDFFRVKLTSPGYRNNFYPGQDSSRVVGSVRTARPGPVTVTFEAPGVRGGTRTLPEGGGTFAFETSGFQDGDGFVTVFAGGDKKTVKVRKLKPLGHRMTWIENGNIVVNGRPTLRRNFYALKYLGGKKFHERYDADDFHETPEFYASMNLQVDDLVRGAEQREAILDVMPSKEVLAKVDEVIAAALKSDVAYYYLSDEPECRGVSAVYLRHLYDYVAEKDPYHVISIATRGGTRFIECADLFETHPYLNPFYENGKRMYDRNPNTIGDFVECFSSLNRADKCIGFLPTAFSFAGADFITFREYVMHVWAAMMRGAKTLWPFAYLGLGTRESIYEGSRYVFSTFARLEPFILFGKRTTLARSPEYESVEFALPTNRLFVCVNLQQTARTVEIPWDGPELREFRGSRSFVPAGGKLRLSLEPLESVVATVTPCDDGLSTYGETQKRIDAAEYLRTHRDNQLFERDLEIEVTSSAPNGSYRSLFDGVLDTLGGFDGWYHHLGGPVFFEMAFPKFTPSFSKLRLFGSNLAGVGVKARCFGEWKTLVPESKIEEPYFLEYDFGETIRPVKLRFDFPRLDKKEWVELYEIELPGKVVERPKKPTPLLPVLTITETTNMLVKVGAGAKWLAMDVIEASRLEQKKYTGFTVQMTGGIGKLWGSVNGFESGRYTIRLPEQQEEQTLGLSLYDYNMKAVFGRFELGGRPANSVQVVTRKKGEKVVPGDLLGVKVILDEPCADVSCLIRRDWGRGPEPFQINGSDALELHAVDSSGKVWQGKIAVQSCGEAKAREVFLKVTTLGGALELPLFTTILEPFGSGKQ